MKRIIVGMAGATGALYGVRIIEALHKLKVETDLVITPSSVRNLSVETNYTIDALRPMVAHLHEFKNIGASIASGSYHVNGMIVAPCSIKALSAIANSYNENLLVRAADVNLKERRKLVLVVCETPLHEVNLELMMRVTQMGGIIMPPVPALYSLPKTVDDIINQTVNEVLNQFSFDLAPVNKLERESENDDEENL
jgi:flavin prenyltransferase